MGDTVTVALPGGGTGVQLQVNLSTNDDKVTPALRLLAAAGVTEELKARDPMRWVGLMNTLTAQIEEILIRELICS